MVAMPFWPAAGVTTTLLLTLGTATPKWTLAEGTRVGFEEDAVRVNASPSVSLTAKAATGVAVLMGVVWVGIAPIEGAPTVRTNELVVKFTESSTMRVMVVAPCWPVAGGTNRTITITPASLA